MDECRGLAPQHESAAPARVRRGPACTPPHPSEAHEWRRRVGARHPLQLRAASGQLAAASHQESPPPAEERRHRINTREGEGLGQVERAARDSHAACCLLPRLVRAQRWHKQEPRKQKMRPRSRTRKADDSAEAKRGCLLRATRRGPDLTHSGSMLRRAIRKPAAWWCLFWVPSGPKKSAKIPDL